MSIKHRNHLGVMTALSLYFAQDQSTSINFTSIANNLFVRNTPFNNAGLLTGSTRIINGKRALYSGNANIELSSSAFRFISYNNNSNSDRTALFNFTGASGTINTYNNFDLDLNGFSRFNGVNNDRIIILNNTANSNQITTFEQTPN